MNGIALLDIYKRVLYYVLFFSALLGIFKISAFIKAFFKKFYLDDTDKKGKYAIVIPARNESKVIEGLLKSIKKQDYDQSLLDIYVVVRDESDPTVEIAKKYNAIVKCVYANSKPEVLDYIFKYMIENKKEYDASFIIDADNILKPNFITEMNKSYQMGYPIGVGYRNNKEWNNGVVSACSALTFFMLNTLQNRPNNETNQNMIISGTGYYIDYNLIKEFNGWPFTTLTEDYELSMYCTLNDIKVRYVETAEFLDEQPTSFKVSFIQRLRWVKGFLQSHRKYKKELNEIDNLESGNRFIEKLKTKIGVWPFIIAIVAVVAYMICILGTLGVGYFFDLTNRMVLVQALFRVLLIIYLGLVAFSFILFMMEHRRINIKFTNMIKACLFNPIFLATYVVLIVKALKNEEVVWTPIAHTINKDDEDK